MHNGFPAKSMRGQAASSLLRFICALYLSVRLPHCIQLNSWVSATVMLRKVRFIGEAAKWERMSVDLIQRLYPLS